MVAVGLDFSVERGASGGSVSCPYIIRTVAIFDLDYDAILSAMYTLSASAEGDCYRCVPPDPGIKAAALGASESSLPGTAHAEALHTFTMDSGASRCCFRDSTTLTPLPAPVPVSLADPSGGLVVACSSTVLPSPAVPSGSLTGLHLPSFSANFVSTAALLDAMVTTTTPGGQRVSICMCTLTGRHLATFIRWPGSSLYTLATKPPQTLLWHHHLGHPSLPHLRGMHSRLLVSCLPRSLPPLSPSPAPPCLPCIEGQQRAAPHSSSFPPTTAPLQTLHMDVMDLPVLRLHSDKGGELSSDLLQDFCHGEGTLQLMLPDSPENNGIAERCIGLVMEVAHTSMIHAAAPHFLWPFAVRCAGHQLNLWPRVSLPETSPTLRWTGEVGDASVFWVRGSRVFVRDTSADKLSAHAIPCVFLGFSPDARGWQSYHPTSRCVFPSQDITFDDAVPVEVADNSCAARGTASGDAEPGGAESEGAGSGGVQPGGAEPGGAEPAGVELGGAEPEGVEPGFVESEGAESGCSEPRGVASSGGPAVASPRLSPRLEPLSPQQLREWLVWRARLRSGATGARATGDTKAGGAGVTAGVGGAGGTNAGGAGAGGAGAGGTGAGGTRAGGAEAGGTGAGARAVDPGAGGAGGTGAGGTVRPQPYFVPLLQQDFRVPSSTTLTPPLLCPPPDQSQPSLQPTSPLPAPSPYTEQSGSLTERREPASRPVSPVRTARRFPRSRPPPVPGTHAMALRPSSVPLRIPLPPPPESSLPAVPDLESGRVRAASPTVSRLLATVVTDPSFESAAASALVAELLDFAAACRLDYASILVGESKSASPPSVGDIPTPRSYVEAITGPYSSQWQAAMDAKMASWKSTSSYVDAIPPSRANIVDGMWIFRVNWPPGSPAASKARYVSRGFSQRQGVDYFQTFSPTPKMTTLRVLLHVAAQRDYELHSLDFSTAFLQGCLHEEIKLRRPPGFTGSFPAGTQWSLRQPVYGLRQAPHEWHDTLRTTLAALGFPPSTADPSLFLRTDTSLPPFYVLVYIDNLVFATADTKALTLVKSELQKRHTCTDLGELRSYLGLQITRDRARRTITLTQSRMSVEPSGLYPELVGCLMYLMNCTRPDLAYPLSLLARYVAPDRHRKVHWDAAKRVLRYLCSTSGMGLVLGGWGPVLLIGRADASWVDESSTSTCEAEIYAGAMAAQELRWLTYLLTGLGEQPRSPPVLYVDNRAMIALCQEHRLEHRTKHIALHYFLARELQQRGQLRLEYMATRANTADIFTKALPPGDHQRFSTVLGLVPTLPHLLTA
ncbi:unnamed protein product [Closterium sp. NIES-53]